MVSLIHHGDHFSLLSPLPVLREQVKKLQEQRAHYQSISKSVEQSMKEQNEASDTFKTTMEKRLQEVTQGEFVCVLSCPVLSGLMLS